MEVVLAALRVLIPALSPVAVILVVLLFMPEKIEKWSALLWRLLSSIGALLGGAFGFASKNYIAHDLQGRVNDFVRRLRAKDPGLPPEKLKIEWIDPNTERSGFIANDNVVIRLRREDPQDHNFVHGAYLFVATSLLRKPKRYLSPSQREALDLFVCTKLIEQEKPTILGFFLDSYLHPRTDGTKTKVAMYIDDLAIIDQGDLFFNVFLVELEYLGEKVFGRRRDDLVISEVNNLIGFLKPIATRKIGDTGDLNFAGAYCKVGFVIVGKPAKLLTSIQPYVSYIQKHLVANGVETIYLLSRAENQDKLEQVVEHFVATFQCVRRRKYTGKLRYSDGTRAMRQYLMILRRQGLPVIRPSQ